MPLNFFNSNQFQAYIISQVKVLNLKLLRYRGSVLRIYLDCYRSFIADDGMGSLNGDVESDWMSISYFFVYVVGDAIGYRYW